MSQARTRSNRNNTVRTPVAPPAAKLGDAGLKITPPQLREIAGMVAEILRSDLRAVQGMQARAQAAQPRVAEPAAQLTPVKPQPRKPAPERKPAKAPEPRPQPRKSAHDPSDEPASAAAFGALSERFSRAIGRSASAAWCDISRLTWDWYSESAPNTIRLVLSGDHAERASQWSARWLDLQHEVRGFEYVGRTSSGVYEIRIGLRTVAVVPWE